MRKLTNILVTGGAGFIGVNFIRFLFGEAAVKPDFSGRIINLDALTYAGNAASIKGIAEKYGGVRYFLSMAIFATVALLKKFFKSTP